MSEPTSSSTSPVAAAAPLPVADQFGVGLRVGYLLKQYPRLSETFILSEILGLEQHGVGIDIFSLRHATEGRFHPAVAQVRGRVRYLSDVDKTSFLAALRALPGLRTEALPEVFAFLDRIPEANRSRLVLQAIEVARAVNDEGINHLHAHFLTVAAHTAHLVHLLTGVPYSVTAHAKDIYRHTVDWDISGRVAGAAAAVVTVCDANLRYLAHRLDGTPVHLVRIYNGLGPQDPPTPADARTPGLILGVGRLVEKKGFDLLLEAVAVLAPRRPDVHCVLVGDGEERPALEAHTERLGLRDRVTFTGSLGQHDVAAWMRRAQIMAAPCRVGEDGNQDALPTVLIEALGAGLPAVSTPVAGIPEIITDGVEGRIVPCGDVSALASGIADLLDDPATLRSMSHAGPAKLAAHFDRNRTIVELIGTFRAGVAVA